jgi:hypothetical protein
LAAKIADSDIGNLVSHVTRVTCPLLTLRTHRTPRAAICHSPHETPTMTEALRTVARRRPLGMLAALLLCTALTACGGDSDSTPPANNPGTGSPAAKPQLKCAP